jgi:hypothetical protein
MKEKYGESFPWKKKKLIEVGPGITITA